MTEPHATSRAERRARTSAAILEAARAVFAANGYQRATIRAVAAQAKCDPALVMQHFGNKRALFMAASEIDLDVAEIDSDGVMSTVRTLRHTFERLDANPQAAASTLRSMLAHDEFAEEALKLFNPPTRTAVVSEDEDLQHQLVVALILGTAITRYVLPYPAVQRADLDDLVGRLEAAVNALVQGAGTP